MPVDESAATQFLLHHQYLGRECIVCKNAYSQSYSNGIAFEIRCIERGRTIDKSVIHDPKELQKYINKFAGN